MGGGRGSAIDVDVAGGVLVVAQLRWSRGASENLVEPAGGGRGVGRGEDGSQGASYGTHLRDVGVGQLDRLRLSVIAQDPCHLGDGHGRAGVIGSQDGGERCRPLCCRGWRAFLAGHSITSSCNVLLMIGRYKVSAYFTGAVVARTADEMSAPALLLLGLAVAGSAHIASLLYAGLPATAAAGRPPLGGLLGPAPRPGSLLAGALGGSPAGLGLLTMDAGPAPGPPLI